MSAERLRKIHKLLFIIWCVPGIPLSIVLRNSVAWVVFLSVYAVVMEHFIGWRQEHANSPETEDES
jgi:hypothetical protein